MTDNERNKNKVDENLYGSEPSAFRERKSLITTYRIHPAAYVCVCASYHL